MDFLKILLIIIVLGLLVGFVYYYQLITGFKKLIKFEQEIKKNPNDALVKQYMIKYKKTFFPKKDSILESRANFYHTIKESTQVSYEVKRELRYFLEAEGVRVMKAYKNESKKEIEE